MHHTEVRRPALQSAFMKHVFLRVALRTITETPRSLPPPPTHMLIPPSPSFPSADFVSPEEVSALRRRATELLSAFEPPSIASIFITGKDLAGGGGAIWFHYPIVLGYPSLPGTVSYPSS